MLSLMRRHIPSLGIVSQAVNQRHGLKDPNTSPQPCAALLQAAKRFAECRGRVDIPADEEGTASRCEEEKAGVLGVRSLAPMISSGALNLQYTHCCCPIASNGTSTSATLLRCNTAAMTSKQ